MLFVYFHVMSIVRVHSRDARSLIAEYDNAAGKIDGAIPVLSPLVSEAMGLLERAVMPANDPMADLYDAAVGMGKDGRDVGWRLELIETGDSRPMGEHTVLNVSYANAWIDGDTSLVEALIAAGLTEAQANEAAKAVNGGDGFGDAVLEQLTKGDGKVPLELLPLLAPYLSEAEILNIQLRSEYEAELERLAEASEGLFDVNPFTIPFDEIDDRIEEVRRERNHWDPDVTLRADLEVEILTAIREGLEAEDGDFGFVLSPEDAVARRADGQLEQTTALSEIFADDDNNLGDIATVLTDLNEIQLDQSAVQFEHALTHEPDFTDPADIAYTIAVTRAVLGVDELGNPQHDAEGLGVSEETFVTGYQNNTIAELVELELYAAGLSPVEYLTAQELDAISLLETHFHALMAIGAVQENPSNIPLVLIDGDQGYSLTWDQLVAIANGDHINEPLISDEYGNEPYFLADLLEYYDTVPGLTIDSLEDLQAIAQIIVANPRAFEALVGAHDGTEVIQGEELTGDLRGGVTAEDFAGFQSQERLRQLIGQLSGDIDSIKDGEEIDGDISAQDFALFILENPDIPAELKDQINQAIESGLTDQGGWEKIQGAFETAGIVVGGLTLLALPGGNVIVLGSLAATGVLIGAGEALAAHKNGDSEALAWALFGTAFDLVDVTEVATVGFSVAIRRAANRATGITIDSEFMDDFGSLIDSALSRPGVVELIPSAKADPLARERLRQEMISAMADEGMPTERATSIADALLFPNGARSTTQAVQLREQLHVAELAEPVLDSLRTTGELPAEYIPKAQAESAGWAPGKALNNYVPGGSLGGDVFDNFPPVLPEAPGRVWFEADIGLDYTMGRGKQAGHRLVYSNDGLAYVSADHYKSFLPVEDWLR